MKVIRLMPWEYMDSAQMVAGDTRAVPRACPHVPTPDDGSQPDTPLLRIRQ